MYNLTLAKVFNRDLIEWFSVRESDISDKDMFFRLRLHSNIQMLRILHAFLKLYPKIDFLQGKFKRLFFSWLVFCTFVLYLVYMILVIVM